MRKVTAVIVTYNRKALLEKCLNAIAAQTRKPDAVLVIDNSSTDGTLAWLHEWLPIHLPQATLLPLDKNTGGAGGFSTGLKQAINTGTDWAWMMDDDAEPHPTALSELMHVATEPRNIYGSLAVNGDETSWLTTLLGEQNIKTNRVSDIPKQARVTFIPLLGFLIHRSLVEKIGYPDEGYFIAADDVEYCIRAQRTGAQIIIAGKSHIEHPKSRPYQVKLPGYTLTALELPPWKRYYDTRNRLLIARKYYGLKLFTHTIPGSFVRLFAALAKEPHKLAQLKAFSAGMFDGLLGIKGKRHETWGIK